ncbi:uncharacterized protein F4822DRAFT_414829 [Hypoxylon trugodes]|uniref:uncharacterized protein n=1 Tax=Hypoxylon trugodes TaxID=326681 RepID=UPI00219A2499|nr:uncharacterized protein F4822DRAFT_414829 [Hypoxylon trugodes]KAI1386039.1 hypothetical protein F4822DRAFT_414829 [Hypoxylon trugodes]
MEVLRHVGRWEQGTKISDMLSSAPIHKAIVHLYVKVLGFLISSTRWLKKAAPKRFGASIIGLKADKFAEKLKQMRGASDVVDKEIQVRGMRRFALEPAVY